MKPTFRNYGLIGNIHYQLLSLQETVIFIQTGSKYPYKSLISEYFNKLLQSWCQLAFVNTGVIWLI